jgi:hypothetical protein
VRFLGIVQDEPRGDDRGLFADVVTVCGKSVYEGETIYSARGGQVIFTYWNSLGGLGTGTASLAPDLWRFSGTVHGHRMARNSRSLPAGSSGLTATT